MDDLIDHEDEPAEYRDEVYPGSQSATRTYGQVHASLIAAIAHFGVGSLDV